MDPREYWSENAVTHARDVDVDVHVVLFSSRAFFGCRCATMRVGVSASDVTAIWGFAAHLVKRAQRHLPPRLHVDIVGGGLLAFCSR